jgi:hypothetical protein
MPGHFAPATFLSYPRLIRPLSEGGAGLSKGQAVDILCQEWDNYVRNRAVIKKHGLESKVDLWEGKAMTVYGSEEELKSATDAYDQWRAAMRDNGIEEDYSDNKFYKDRDEAVKVGFGRPLHALSWYRSVGSRAPLDVRRGTPVPSTHTSLRPSFSSSPWPRTTTMFPCLPALPF